MRRGDRTGRELRAGYRENLRVEGVEDHQDERVNAEVGEKSVGLAVDIRRGGPRLREERRVTSCGDGAQAHTPSWREWFA